MILELDEDEAAVEVAIVRTRVQVDVDDALQYLGQLRQELLLGLGLRHAAEEEAAVVYGLDHADAMSWPDLVAVEDGAGISRDPRLLVQSERVAARRPGEVQHQSQLQQPADLLQHRHQLVLVAVARQPAQEYLGAFAALTLSARHFRRRQAPLAVLLQGLSGIFSRPSFYLYLSLFLSLRSLLFVTGIMWNNGERAGKS